VINVISFDLDSSLSLASSRYNSSLTETWCRETYLGIQSSEVLTLSLLPMRVQGKNIASMASPSILSLKRAGTMSTKESYSTNDCSAYSYYNFPSYNQENNKSGISAITFDNCSITSRRSLGAIEETVVAESKSLVPKEFSEQESLQSSQSAVKCDSVEGEYEDTIIETDIKNRSLSLVWDHSTTVTNNKSVVNDACQLPAGISRSDIMVTLDIDDEALSSRAAELDEEDLDVEILHHKKQDSGDFSPHKQCHRNRRDFEKTIHHSILDDLKSVYTATPKTAKLVLCVVVSVLSDGTLEHTFWSGGRVGLTEIVLQWVLFDADDLQVYKRGNEVQRKDFGFGPLGLTVNEGQHYLAAWLAPKATNAIMRKIGYDACQDLMIDL